MLYCISTRYIFITFSCKLQPSPSTGPSSRHLTVDTWQPTPGRHRHLADTDTCQPPTPGSHRHLAATDTWQPQTLGNRLLAEDCCQRTPDNRLLAVNYWQLATGSGPPAVERRQSPPGNGFWQSTPGNATGFRHPTPGSNTCLPPL
jgi:hypothetical protein